MSRLARAVCDWGYPAATLIAAVALAVALVTFTLDVVAERDEALALAAERADRIDRLADQIDTLSEEVSRLGGDPTIILEDHTDPGDTGNGARAPPTTSQPPAPSSTTTTTTSSSSTTITTTSTTQPPPSSTTTSTAPTRPTVPDVTPPG